MKHLPDKPKKAAGAWKGLLAVLSLAFLFVFVCQSKSTQAALGATPQILSHNSVSLKDTISANTTTTHFIHKRDDSGSSSDESKQASSSALGLLVVRIMIGIGVFAVLNVIVITAHHLAQKISRSGNSYHEVEHDYSPF